LIKTLIHISNVEYDKSGSPVNATIEHSQVQLALDNPDDITFIDPKGTHFLFKEVQPIVKYGDSEPVTSFKFEAYSSD